jgi:hypothetical protein
VLGDWVSAALSAVGVTPQRVARWLGRPCDCEERKAKLNALHAWARRWAAGHREGAREYVERVMRDDDGGTVA